MFDYENDVLCAQSTSSSAQAKRFEREKEAVSFLENNGCSYTFGDVETLTDIYADSYDADDGEFPENSLESIVINNFDVFSPELQMTFETAASKYAINCEVAG